MERRVGTMKSLKCFLRNTKGAFSILFVILIFIGVMIATAFMDMLVKSYTLQEVQSVMDVAGVSALQTGVDSRKLRVEIFDVDKNVVESNYKRLVSERMNESQKIINYRFVRTTVETFNENWGLGITGKSRPQALIDSTMVIVVENSPMWDLIPGANETFYNSRDGEFFDVTYLGTTQDGQVELSIRSVSRIVYR